MSVEMSSFNQDLSRAFQFEGHEVRVVMRGGLPWFVAKDGVELSLTVTHP